MVDVSDFLAQREPRSRRCRCYTTSKAERDEAIRTYGYQLEGTAGHVYVEQREGTTPLFRLVVA